MFDLVVYLVLVHVEDRFVCLSLVVILVADVVGSGVE